MSGELSAEAEAYLAMMASLPQTPPPAADDIDAWRAAVMGSSSPGYAEAIAKATTGAVDSSVEVSVETIAPANCDIHIGTPLVRGAADDRVLLSVHGGAFTVGGGEASRVAAGLLAGAYEMCVWSVDYRMPPDHPFPAALDDCLDAYRAALTQYAPENIAITGLSAGGNLVAALIQQAHAQGLPMPRAVVLNSPLVDLTLSGDSIVNNSSGDDGSLGSPIALYAAGHDLVDPRLSPLRGDVHPDWPRTLLFSGTRDFLLSDTVRFHQKLLAAGVEAGLEVFESAPHGMFGGNAPEDRILVAHARRFLESAWTGDRH
jgi:acetyl esterase/lipase